MEKFSENDYRELIIRAWVKRTCLQDEDWKKMIRCRTKKHESAIDCAIRMAGYPPLDLSGTSGDSEAKRQRLIQHINYQE